MLRWCTPCCRSCSPWPSSPASCSAVAAHRRPSRVTSSASSTGAGSRSSRSRWPARRSPRRASPSPPAPPDSSPPRSSRGPTPAAASPRAPTGQPSRWPRSGGTPAGSASPSPSPCSGRARCRPALLYANVASAPHNFLVGGTIAASHGRRVTARTLLAAFRRNHYLLPTAIGLAWAVSGLPRPPGTASLSAWLAPVVALPAFFALGLILSRVPLRPDRDTYAALVIRLGLSPVLLLSMTPFLAVPRPFLVQAGMATGLNTLSFAGEHGLPVRLGRADDRLEHDARPDRRGRLAGRRVSAAGLPRAPVEGAHDGIAYGEWPGTGSPVLCVHGISANLLGFLSLADALGPHRIVAPDLRGRGRSTQEGPFGLTRHAEDVLGLADALELERPLLVGHSFGAFVARPRRGHRARPLLGPGAGRRRRLAAVLGARGVRARAARDLDRPARQALRLGRRVRRLLARLPAAARGHARAARPARPRPRRRARRPSAGDQRRDLRVRLPRRLPPARAEPPARRVPRPGAGGARAARDDRRPLVGADPGHLPRRGQARPPGPAGPRRRRGEPLRDPRPALRGRGRGRDQSAFSRQPARRPRGASPGARARCAPAGAPARRSAPCGGRSRAASPAPPRRARSASG